MRFFKLARANTAFNYSRQLWMKIPPRPEIVIGNNTALFGVLASIAKHGIQNHPDLKVICPEFWLDNAHPCHLNEKWGQTLSGLPKIARELLSALYPAHADNNFITWGQMQELRKTALLLLENNYQVPVYHGVPSITKLIDNSFGITVGDKQFNATKDTHFYFWYKVPKRHELANVIQRPSTEIYQLNPSELPTDLDIIVLGGGLSVYWLAKHFAKPSDRRRIISIIRESDQLKMNVPSNSSVDANRIVVVTLEKSTISFAKDDSRIAIVKNCKSGKEYAGLFYTAIGVTSPDYIVKDVPESQLTSPKNWIASKWISSKNIPVGSLMENILQWFEITNNLEWGFEPQSYHEANNPLVSLIENNFSPETKIDMNYFHGIKNAIVNLDNPLPDTHVSDFFVQIYRNTYNPTPLQINLFEKDINRLLQQRLDLVYSEQMTEAHPEFTP